MRFENNPGGDPVGRVADVPTFPARGHKGIVKAGEVWDCVIVFAATHVIMVAPRRKLGKFEPHLVGVPRVQRGSKTEAVGLDVVVRLLRGKREAPPAPMPPAVPPAKVAAKGPSKPVPPAPVLPVLLSEIQSSGGSIDRLRTILRIEQDVEDLETADEAIQELVGSVQGDIGSIRRALKDNESQVEEFRSAAREWRRNLNNDLRGVPKPVPADPNNPTPEEIEREVVHQLYQKDCWNNKYGQYEKLKRGYNSKAADRDVRAAVKRLVDRGWLSIYPKSTDQYRLVTKYAKDIYAFLGVPSRDIERLVDEVEAPREDESLEARDLAKVLKQYATRDDLERAISGVTSRLRGIESSTPAVQTPTGGVSAHEFKNLTAQVRALQGEVNRLKKANEELTAQIRRAPVLPPVNPRGEPRGSPNSA